MTLRFLLDEDLSDRIADGLRRRGIDALSVHGLGREGLADEEQLAFAAEEQRVLVTYNRSDFQALDTEWRRRGREHAGILWCAESIIPRRAIGALVDSLEMTARRSSDLQGQCLPLGRSGQPPDR